MKILYNQKPQFLGIKHKHNTLSPRKKVPSHKKEPFLDVWMRTRKAPNLGSLPPRQTQNQVFLTH